MISAILTDIEGTTSSIHFVKEVLFPFARKRLPAFIETHNDQPIIQHWLHEAAKEAGLIAASLKEIVELLQRWIDEDRKATALKALQGLIWQEGYRLNEFKAHIYEDAARCLRAWHALGLPLYVYSSGSVTAQKLFFEHTEAGDLSFLFSGYFDTEVGAKREALSYRKIADAIGIEPRQILFLSDVEAELDAARSIGMKTTLVCREPLSTPSSGVHPEVSSFDSIDLS